MNIRTKLVLLSVFLLIISGGVFYLFPGNIIVIAAVIVVGGGIAFGAAGAIVKPIEQLKGAAQEIAKGNLEIKLDIDESAELGGVAKQIQNTATTLVNRIEEQKNLNQRLSDQKKEIEQTTDEIHYINEQITASINYAERIQRSMLPNQKMLKGIFKESLIIYKPKDVVSGDFYWFERMTRGANEYIVVAAADCTGHGVPGAIMSMMGNNLLTNIVYYQNYLDPDKIITRMDQEIKYELKQEGDDSKDGMEMGLCVIDLDSFELDYAGGGIPLYILRNGELMVEKADKVMLGGMVARKEGENPINVRHLQLEKGDQIYLCSDGFQDQFGGPSDKKFMAKRLRELFVEVGDKPMKEQQEIIENRFMEWKGEGEQTDDVMLLGFKV